VTDKQPRRKRRERVEADPSQAASRRPGRPRLSGPELARGARRELAEITGLEAESVTALARAQDGTWRVTVELLELARIPETDDLLGSYGAQLDDGGELLRYRRLRRYPRSRG
jgi:ADP-ribose pyrophosphatase YjhB (NUDIX family)